MKDFFNGIGSLFSWLFKRLPTEGQSIRAEIKKLEKEWDICVKKKTSLANVNRMRNISARLRVLYEKAADKTP